MDDVSLLKQRVNELNKTRTDLINKVLMTKPFIAAQVYQRYKKCGNPNCRCARGELHGPYTWIYQKKKGQKVVSTTVVKGKTIEAEEMAKRYERLLGNRERIRKIDQEINDVMNLIETYYEREVTDYVKR